jgi:tetratricopeptide (TPR) repeat protein
VITPRIVRWLGLLIVSAVELPGLPTAAQTTPPKEAPPPAPALRKLTGDDARRAEELDRAVEAAVKADRWDEAITRAAELLALRARAQGPKHFETVTEELRLKALRRVATLSKEDRVAYQSARTMNQQGETLYAQGKYAQAQTLFEQALETRRRLLTDDQPDTASSYNNLALNLNAQGRYAAAQPLYEKAQEINHRLLGDDHPHTAASYENLAGNLMRLGKFSAAQPLLEKALEINRRLLGDDHPQTASSYNDLAYNRKTQGRYAQAQTLYEKALEFCRRRLGDDDFRTATTYNNLAMTLREQGRYAQAQPLFEKALEIRCLLLTDDHPHTAQSYENLAGNLYMQGKYAEAQPLGEKALGIRRRLHGDDHPEPDTATSYNNLALNLRAQGRYEQAQPLFEKALEIYRRLLSDDHPNTANSYKCLASNLDAQGRYEQAQPLLEKALEIYRRLLSDDHPHTASSYSVLAMNLHAQGRYEQAQPLLEKALEIHRQLHGEDHRDTANSYSLLAMNLNVRGKYAEACDRWLSAVKSLDAARLQVAFTGLERAGIKAAERPALAAVLARLGQPAAAWQALEEDLGRGLLDELVARKDGRLNAAERDSLRELTAELERLDRLVETTPTGLDQAERARRFNDLKHQRAQASIALGEFQTRLVQEYGPLAGRVAGLDEVRAALHADAALLAWVDIPPVGSNAADPDGEHWAVVVRARGIPAWVPIAGSGPDGLWTRDDTALAGRVRTGLRRRPGTGSADLRPLIEKLRAQRLEPLARALDDATDGLPPARRLVVLPSRALAGIPVEALLARGDTRTVSYAPSATVFKYLREQPRPDRHAGLLALGDPVYRRDDSSGEPGPLPDHGLLVNVVAPGSNAATHGIEAGDVLLAYNGAALRRREDLKAVPEPGRAMPVEVWRHGRVARRELAPGKLGVVLDPRPAPEAIAANRAMEKILVAARGGSERFAPLPGTRLEVDALARLFHADDRPSRTLLAADASEPALDRLAAAGELTRFGFLHLATHGVIDEGIPTRSAVILTQTGLPDPLEQVLHQKPVFDGRLSVREIERTWQLNAELVTLSACETALGPDAGGEGFVGFTQALLMSGARSVCLSLWKVDDTATALLMQRFYANLLGRRIGLSGPMPKAEALAEAKAWLRGLRRGEVLALAAELSGGVERGKDAEGRQPGEVAAAVPAGGADDRVYAAPHFWAAFVLAGDPN